MILIIKKYFYEPNKNIPIKINITNEQYLNIVIIHLQRQKRILIDSECSLYISENSLLRNEKYPEVFFRFSFFYESTNEFHLIFSSPLVGDCSLTKNNQHVEALGKKYTNRR